MEDGEEGGDSFANLLSHWRRWAKVVNYLEEAKDQYEKVKNFLGCNPCMINNV